MASSAPAGQTSLEDLVVGTTDLSQVTFVVVDLETTGASAATCAITEVGAVRVRAGEVVGELSTLVRPPGPVPAEIVALTGITEASLVGAPPIAAVLPPLLEMLHGAVLVAHNARFDVAFLRAAARATGAGWPEVTVLDTLALARAVLPRPEVRDHRLATLAEHLGASTTPTHRALDDARATVDVLHALIARMGNRGVTTLEELLSVAARGGRVSDAVRSKRSIAAQVPHGPGVYVFRAAGGEVLYVGSSRDLRTRVRTYFTASEKRSRMAEMVGLATEVLPVPTATVLEARVRELRLIAEHDPRYNRRSRRPERAPWLKLTVEPFPRLSVVRERRDDAGDGAVYLGPFRRAEDARRAAAALHAALPLRQCTSRLPARAAPGATACVLADIGRCGAPCTGGVDVAGYAAVVGRARTAMLADAGEVVAACRERMARAAAALRFEDAAGVREEMAAFLRGARRAQRLDALAAVGELVAAVRTGDGGWELVCVRRGRLAGTTVAPRGADPMPYVEALVATSEQVPAAVAPVPADGRAGQGPPWAAGAEEGEMLLAWLESPGVRLVRAQAAWASPVAGAASVPRHVRVRSARR